MSSIKLDKRNRLILYELDVNSRQSVAMIAKKVGISRQAVNYRIKNLEKKGRMTTNLNDKTS